jgi:hypothetical protein
MLQEEPELRTNGQAKTKSLKLRLRWVSEGTLLGIAGQCRGEYDRGGTPS